VGPATKMLRVASFVERYPNDGMRPGEATVAYLGYNAQPICLWPFSAATRRPIWSARTCWRAMRLDDDDTVQVMLDTFSRSAPRLRPSRSNPLGIPGRRPL